MKLSELIVRFVKKRLYVKCIGKYYYWCYLNIKFFRLVFFVVYEKKLNILYFDLVLKIWVVD